MKKQIVSLKKLKLTKLKIAELSKKSSIIGGKTIRCTSVGCGLDYPCGSRDHV